MENENKSVSFLNAVGKNIVDCICTKWIGCFVALAAVVLSIAQAIAYSGVNEQDFNSLAVVLSVLGAVFFIILSLFKQTSPLAPIALVICDFVALLVFASSLIDFFSTAFFGGFSFGALFAQPLAYSFSTILFVLSFVVSSVAMWIPQNRKDNGASVEIKEGNDEY